MITNSNLLAGGNPQVAKLLRDLAQDAGNVSQLTKATPPSKQERSTG